MSLNSRDVATLAFPYFKKCMSDSKEVGFFVKTFSRPFWFALTKIGIDVAVTLTRPKLEPLLQYIVQIIPVIPDSFIPDKQFIMAFLELLQTQRADMDKAVQMNFPFLDEVANKPTTPPERLVQLVRGIQYD